MLLLKRGMKVGIRSMQFKFHQKKHRLSDTMIVFMVDKLQNNPLYSPPFQTGFLVGDLSTLAQKGTYQRTNDAFCEGYQEGMQAYCLLGRRHVFTLSEICSLMTWKHQEKENTVN